MTPDETKICDLELQVGVLKEKINGADKALLIAKSVVDATELAVRAQTTANYAKERADQGYRQGTYAILATVAGIIVMMLISIFRNNH